MDSGCAEKLPSAYNDTIILPDTLSHARKGTKSEERASGYLTDPYKFEGCAWFGRYIDITEEAAGQELYIRLERTRLTELFIDGTSVGKRDSLCTPHVYALPELEAGRHRVDIRVCNVGYPTKGGHLTSPDTQTNWLGITGRIELIARPTVHIDDICVQSGSSAEKVVVSFVSTGVGEARVRIDSGKELACTICGGVNTFTYIPNERLTEWDEFSPCVHELHISMNGEEQTVAFGIRKFEARGRKLFVNGRETFLRGKHDGMIFPMTGYAPTDVESWLKVMGTAKEFGINHYRFHTCCPPEAAFTAADILGIYMQPELPFWGTVADEPDDEQRYLIEEGSRILKEYGNHPSFVMMSLGNELWGSKDVLNGIIARYKSEDDRHLYTDGSNNFQFFPCVLENADFLSGVRLSRDRLYRGSYAMCDAPQGFIQTNVPNTVHNYDSIIVPEKACEASEGGKVLIQYGTGVKEVEAEGGDTFIPDVPVISHEVGQYETYPDFSETEKYTGTLKAENIALYREKAEENGLIGYAGNFFRASGALAVDCYKREIEAALKSSELSGFQLLDIQDFTGQGTALVGVLNTFMEPKGTVTAQEWRQFCNKTVIMAELEKFVFPADEGISFGITLFNTDPSFRGKHVRCMITRDGVCENSFTVDVRAEKRVVHLADAAAVLSEITAPAAYELTLAVEDTDIRNSYRLWVYPAADVKITENEIVSGDKRVRIVRTQEDALAALSNGEKVLYVPDANGKLPGTYCTDFWCYPMFRSISESMGKPVPIGTLGLLIDNESPLLSDFPSDTHTTPQWYNIVSHSHCEDLTGSDIIPDVWVIDNPDRAKKLALLYEMPTKYGALTVCTSRLWEISDCLEVRWFARSLAESID